MTRLGGVRGGGGQGGSAVGGRGLGAAPLNVKDLPEEQALAYQLLDALKTLDPAARQGVLVTCGGTDPITAQTLSRVAATYASLGMPLTGKAMGRFKADRSLPTGGGIATASVAKAYARALDGNEILVRVDRGEEMGLRPSERAMLQFLRDMQKKRDAETLRPVKQALGLGNPKLPAAAAGLQNEYVGVGTVKELTTAMTLKSLPLTPDGWRQLQRILDEGGKDE
jgi:hypothetical protein